MGEAPTSQARSRDTDHLRPSNLAARTLYLVEHTLSKFGGDPCPVRRGLAAAVKCHVRKTPFFCSILQRQRRSYKVRIGFVEASCPEAGGPRPG